VIRAAALLVMLGLATAVAAMLRTDASTAIPFSFAGHPVLAAGIALYAWTLLRPVRLSADEQALWKLAFRELRQRDFLRVAELGEWRSAASGDVLLAANAPNADVLVLLEGAAEFRVDGEPVGSVGPGQLVGASVALTGGESWGEAVASEPCRYLALPVSRVAPALERFPEARAALQAIVSRDLADKLRAVTAP